MRIYTYSSGENRPWDGRVKFMGCYGYILFGSGGYFGPVETRTNPTNPNFHYVLIAQICYPKPNSPLAQICYVKARLNNTKSFHKP